MNPVPTTPRLGVLTIGQSPRTDLTPELEELLPGVELVERGVLDGLGAADIDAMRPQGGDVLTTRLSDGSAVVIDEHLLTARVPGALARLEEGVDAVLLACTGRFPPLPHSRPLLVPDRMLAHAIAALAPPDRPVGVLCPLSEQERASAEKIAARLPDGADVVTAAASPYTADEGGLRAAARRLRELGAGMIALDCIGYDEQMREVVADEAGVPVLLGRTVAARLGAELLAAMPHQHLLASGRQDDRSRTYR